jgi:putative transposase
MDVIRAHKILLQPNKVTVASFRRWAGAYRWTYNWALEQKKTAYEQDGKSLSKYDVQKLLTIEKHKPERAWLNDILRDTLVNAIWDMDQAYQNFFRRVKNGEREKGFPKFKSRRTARRVFHVTACWVKLSDDRRSVRLPKLGWVRMTKPLRFDGKLVATVAISEEAGKWYASFTCEVEITDPLPRSDDPQVGIDVGIHTLMTLSDGRRYENPKATYHLAKLLARAQRQLSRREKGSNRWKRAKRRVQRIQKRIKDARVNAAHQATAQVAQTYGLVAMEDLNVKGMVKNRHLAKAVSDSNFYRLRQQLTYKTAWSGSELRLVDRWFPSSKLCSVCGCINEDLHLSDRRWICDCGAVHDRDLNAAKNILAAALRTADESAAAGRGGIGQWAPCEASSGRQEAIGA